MGLYFTNSHLINIRNAVVNVVAVMGFLTILRHDPQFSQISNKLTWISELLPIYFAGALGNFTEKLYSGYVTNYIGVIGEKDGGFKYLVGHICNLADIYIKFFYVSLIVVFLIATYLILRLICMQAIGKLMS